MGHISDVAFARNLDEILSRKDTPTARAVAAQVGIGESELSRYRRGKVIPPVTMAKRIADALGVTLDEMTAETVPPRPLATTAEIARQVADVGLRAAEGSGERRSPAPPLPGGRRRSDPPPRA